MNDTAFNAPSRTPFGHRGMRRSGDSLVRAAAAAIAGSGRWGGAEDALKMRWPDDREASVILRAASSSATMSDSAWAGLLASTSVADFVADLAPASAGAALLSRGMRINLGRDGAVSIPSAIVSTGVANFLGEGAPIPVEQFSITAATLAPFHLKAIAAMTSEAARSTAVEEVTRALLVESASVGLDTKLFSADAAVAGVSPAGLLNAPAAIGATAGGTDEAAIADVANIIATLAPIASGDQIAFAASPATAARLRLRLRQPFPWALLATSALAADTLVAVAMPALVSHIDPRPEIAVGDQGVLHMEDTTPAAIGTAGTPNVVAAPTRSLWQTDSIALRMVLSVSWALRAPSAQSVAEITNVTW